MGHGYDTPMPDDVGIVIPAFRPALPTLRGYVDDLRESLDPTTIVVELDAPASGVAEELRGHGLTVNVAPERRGKGAAVTSGFEYLDTDIKAFADADGSTTATAVADVIAALDHTPVAIGSRRHPDAHIESHQSTVRRRFGDVFARLARVVLGIDFYDFQCGAKALTSTAWEQIRPHLYESGFAWDVEVVAVARALDLEVTEVPISWQDDPESTVDPLWTTLDMFRALIAVRHRTKALRGSRIHRLARRTNQEPLIARYANRE